MELSGTMTSAKEQIDKQKYESHGLHILLGYCLIMIGFMFFVMGWYSIFISKVVMPYTGHSVLDWIKDDKYYCMALPCYLASVCFPVYFNWMAMKYFRHT
jgi:hypothetical protein